MTNANRKPATLTARQSRQLDLMTAQLAARLGHHDRAAEIFARHGITYAHVVDFGDEA